MITVCKKCVISIIEKCRSYNNLICNLLLIRWGMYDIAIQNRSDKVNQENNVNNEIQNNNQNMNIPNNNGNNNQESSDNRNNSCNSNISYTCNIFTCKINE